MAICSWHWFKSLTMSALWVLANIWTQAALLMPLIACFYYPEQWYTNTRCPPTLILFQFFTHFEMFLNVNIFQTFFQRVRGESIICKYIHMCVCVKHIQREKDRRKRDRERKIWSYTPCKWNQRSVSAFIVTSSGCLQNWFERNSNCTVEPGCLLWHFTPFHPRKGRNNYIFKIPKRF